MSPGASAGDVVPGIFVPLDEFAAELAAESVLSLTHRRAAALPFVVAVPPVLAADEACLRHAIECVTDLSSREAALLQGIRVRDTVRVFICHSMLPGQPRRVSLQRAVESVHAVAAAFYAETPFEVHTLALLPDLAERDERRSKYAAAHTELEALRALSSPEFALSFRPGVSSDFRWVVDCRTRNGAHAGPAEEVGWPVAEFLALLIGEGFDLEAQRLPAGGSGNAPILFSSFGLAVSHWNPESLVRYVACRTAAGQLSQHLETPELSVDRAADLNIIEEIERAAQYWATDERLAERAVAPYLTESSEERGLLRARQRDVAELRGSLNARIRDWLLTRELWFSEQVVHALRSARTSSIDLLIPLSAAGLVQRFELELRAYLEIDELEAQLAAVRAEIRTDEESDALREARIAEVERILEQRRGLLDYRAAGWEHGLRDYHAGRIEPSVFAEPTGGIPEVPVSADPAPQAAKPGLFKRLLGRLRRRNPSVTAPEPSGVSEPALHHASAVSAAERFIERRQWLGDYDRALGHIQGALADHRTDLTGAAEYYEAQRLSLGRRLTHDTQFQWSPLGPVDLETCAQRYGDALLEQLQPARVLAAAFEAEQPDLEPMQLALVERMRDFDVKLMASARAVMEPLLETTLADALAGRAGIGTAPDRGAWVAMELEASQALARPATEPEQEVSRILLATPDCNEWLGGAEVVAGQPVLYRPDTNVLVATWVTLLHGFSLAALAKVDVLRRAAGAAAPAAVSLSQAHPYRQRELNELVILAEALHIAEERDTGVALLGRTVSGRLSDLAWHIAHDLEHRDLEPLLRAEVELVLAAADGRDLLRQAIDSAAATELRDFLLSVLAEYNTQQLDRSELAREMLV